MVEPKEPRKARRVLSAKAVGYKAGKKKGFFSQPIDAVIRKIVSASPTLALRHQPAKSNRAKGDSCYFINRFVDHGSLGFVFEVCNYIHGHVPESIAPDLDQDSAEIRAVELKDVDGKPGELVHSFRCIALGDVVIMEMARGQGSGAAALQTLLTALIRRHIDPNHPSVDLADIGSSDLKALIASKGGVQKITAKITETEMPGGSKYGGMLSSTRSQFAGATRCAVSWEAGAGALDVDAAVNVLEEADETSLSGVILYFKLGGNISDLGKYREKKDVFIQVLPDGRIAVSEIETALVDYMRTLRDPELGGPLTSDGKLKNSKLLEVQG